MGQYVVDRVAQANGEHRVHSSSCPYRPAVRRCVDLGRHAGCASAMALARQYFLHSNGCHWCATVCHRLSARALA